MSNKQSNNCELKPCAHLVTKDIRGEFVVVDTQTGDYHIFNHVGSLIWRGLADGKDVAAIVRELVNVYQVTVDQANADCDTFLSELRGYSLLE